MKGKTSRNTQSTTAVRQNNSMMGKNSKRQSGFAKKNDDNIDEESGASKDFMEQKYKQDNDRKLDALADSVTSIKNLSKNIGN